jgi:2-polyprenyl-3-methyl-5-hydroxy-6-metoxy-1,4-benzoquinol methylase
MSLPAPNQKAVAQEMKRFVEAIPPSANLDWVKNDEFLYFFEAERLLIMRKILLSAGFKPESSFEVLDVGYLHGIVPEFLHRFFPKAQFTVLDHPASPVFSNPDYLQIIESRSYLKLLPLDLAQVEQMPGSFDLIVLGEIIEHMDPTTVARVVGSLRQKVRPANNGLLLVTTPNGAGVFNVLSTLFGRDTQVPPIPHDMMNYGHIHLWSPPLLQRTLAHFGWNLVQMEFTHGRENEYFAEVNRHWGSFRHQIFVRLCRLMACLRPKWRGFFVAVFSHTRL